MSSIYIHIPFCKQACSYCDFHFSVNTSKQDDLVKALIKEIQLRKDYLPSESGPVTISTIYFGGGTPSLLSSNQINDIINAVYTSFEVSDDAEITLEANPDDLTKEKLNELCKTKINRLSIGVQSFFEEDLKLMNRAHNATMAIECITDTAAAGFKNITIDLIYGLPGMTEKRWEQNLNTAFSLPVQHLSCYSLTVEKKTLLDKMIRDGVVSAIDDEQSARHFETLIIEAKKHGFDHYEISNFGLPGFYSRHNSNYWKDKPYLGIGPSAHSYNNISRQWNISANAAYILSIERGEIPNEEEVLTIENRYNEYIMTGLRTMWGVDTNHVRSSFGEKYYSTFLQNISDYVESGDVIKTDNSYTLSQKGKLLADRIAAACFVVE